MSLNSARLFPDWRRIRRTTLSALFLVSGLLILSNITQAQFPNQGAIPVLPSGLKKLGFGFVPKRVTRLEITQVTANPAMIPTDPLAYRAETGAAPAPGRAYEQQETQSAQFPYAVLMLKNVTNKTVESIDWEFNYPRFKGDKEEAKVQVSSRFKIPSGQVASLSQRVPRDDCSIRYVADRGNAFITRVCGRKHPRTTGAYPVGAEIKRVKFTDGTVWQAP